MFKKKEADISEIETIGGTECGIPVVEKIFTKQLGAFIDPYSANDKSILQGVNEIGQNDKGYAVFSELKTNKYYTYALTSALSKKTNDILSARSGEEKPKFEKTDKRVKAVLDEWKEKNKDNENLVITIKTLSSPTRYYTGKQGNYIAENAGLDNLKDEELVLLANLCASSKSEASYNIKNGDSDSPWLSERIDFTSEGWRERKILEYEKMYELSLLDNEEYMKKMAWAEEFDFHRGWNFSGGDEYTEIVTIDKLPENALAAIFEFNKYFCLNAINKDKLFVEKEEE